MNLICIVSTPSLQENDFKYLDRHFGIDQLDSRARDDFKNRMDEFKDRSTDAVEYKKLKEESKTISTALAKNLLKQNQKRKRLGAKQIEIKKLEGAKFLPGVGLKRELQKELKKAQKSMERMNESIQKLVLEQKSIEQKLEAAEKKQTEALKKESRIKQLVDGNYQLIDTRRKAYIDALRVNAANIFRNVNDEFRIIYDNYRDDHHHLRLLSRSSGIIIRSQSYVTVKLWLPGTIQKHIISAMEEFLEKLTTKINQNQPNDRKLQIKLLTGAILPL